MVDEFVRIGRPAAGLRLLDARHRRIDGVGRAAGRDLRPPAAIARVRVASRSIANAVNNFRKLPSGTRTSSTDTPESSSTMSAARCA